MASYFIDDSDYLEHYGVLGMKWGVRKERPSSGSWFQDRRNKKADKYLARVNRKNDLINAKQQKRVTKAESKLNKVRTSGASSKKISKLERRASDAKVHAEMIKKRNANLAEANANYKRKSLRTRILSKQFNEKMRKKHGDKQVNRIVAKDIAKAVALVAGLNVAMNVTHLYYKNAS